MTTAIFLHANPVVRQRYESMLGAKIRFVNSTGSQFSSGYDERSGFAREPLPAFLARYAPEWKAPEPLVLLAFSAGCFALRHWLRDAQNRRDVTACVLIDGLHGDASDHLGGVLEFAKLCQAEPGRHRLVVTNSDIDPPYDSTTDAAEWLLDQLGIEREKSDHAIAKGVVVLDAGGTNAEAHSAQLLEHGVAAVSDHVRPFLDGLKDTDPAPPLTPPIHPDPRDSAPWLDPTMTWGERRVALARIESEREPLPLLGTLAKYFLPCVRDGSDALGKWLAAESRRGKRHNHCAATGSWLMLQTRPDGAELPHRPRAGAKECMHDAIERHCWHQVSEVRSGKWMPSIGDAAIYDRGGWKGHYDLVSSVAADGYMNIGANEVPPGKWRLHFTPWDQPNLLGFIAFPQPTGTPSPVDLLTEDEIRRIKDVVALTLHQQVAEAPWETT